MSFYGYGLGFPSFTSFGFPNLSSFGYTGLPSAGNPVTTPIKDSYGEESQARKDFKFFAGVSIAALIIGALLRRKPNQGSRLYCDTFEKTGEKISIWKRLFKRKPKIPVNPSGSGAGAGEAKKNGFFKRLFSRKKAPASAEAPKPPATPPAADSAASTGEAKKTGWFKRLFSRKKAPASAEAPKQTSTPAAASEVADSAASAITPREYFDGLRTQYKSMRKNAVDPCIVKYDNERKLFINRRTLEPFSGCSQEVQYLDEFLYTRNNPIKFAEYKDGKLQRVTV